MEDIGHGFNGTCTVEDRRPGGFMLSEGNGWIIGTGVVVMLGGMAAMIIAEKKRKTKQTPLH